MKQLTLVAVSISLLFASIIGYAQSQNLPDRSVYHLDSQWQDQTGTRFDIADLQGRVRIVAFVYTYCEHTCPTIVAKIKSVVAELPKDVQSEVVVTLVTLDPERDTVERVRSYLESQGLVESGWQVLVGAPDDVLSLAALFDVRYKPMGESDIAHSNVITLVDRNGEIRSQLRGLGQNTDDFAAQTIKAAQTSELSQ